MGEFNSLGEILINSDLTLLNMALEGIQNIQNGTFEEEPEKSQEDDV